MNILRSTSIYAAALVLGAATTTVVLAGSAAHAVDPGPPTHYVVTELMASGDTGNKNFVSPNGRYLLIASDFGGDVYDLVAGESLGVVQGNGTVTLQPQGIDDSGVVVGGYSNTSPSPGLNTGFHWYGKDATHPLGHAVPEEVPGSLIGTYVPICNEPPDNGKFDEMSYYGVGGDGTAYGYAGCGGVAGLFAISRPTNGAVGISGGAQDVGTPQVSPNAALAYGVGENGDIVGAGSNSGLPLLTWSSSNPTPTQLKLNDGTDASNVGTGMLWRSPQDFLGDGEIQWDGQQFAQPNGFTAQALLDYGTLVGNAGGFDGGPEVVQPHIDGTTTVTKLADMATVPIGTELTSILGADQAGDIFGVLQDGATAHFFKAVPGTGSNPVVPKPTITITSPANGHTYTRGTAYKLTYSCKPGTGAKITQCDGGGLPSGTALTTLAASSKPYTLTVTAKQNDNQTASKSVSFKVVNPAPTVSLTSPVNGHVYKKGAKITVHFTCKAGAYTTLKSCKGTAANGAKVKLTSVGKHAFTVTATDKDGRVTTRTIHYTVKK